MRGLLALLLVMAAFPLAAESVWTLRTGPVAVASVPLNPVQMVSSWRGEYGDGTETVWLYATASPMFLAPKSPDVVTVSETPWSVAVFFPAAWKAPERTSWLERWVAEFRTLESLPDKGYPIVFPAILRKG